MAIVDPIPVVSDVVRYENGKKLYLFILEEKKERLIERNDLQPNVPQIVQSLYGM